MRYTIVYTSEATGASVGRDRYGFHVIVEGAAMFGPLSSRSLAKDLADRWRTPVESDPTATTALSTATP